MAFLWTNKTAKVLMEYRDTQIYALEFVANTTQC